MAGIFGYTKFKAFDTNGALLAGGKLYTYQAGTSTPATTYFDNTLSPGSAHTNPILLDSIGEALIWGTGPYKFTLTDANDVPIWTVDNVIPNGVELPLSIPNGGTGATTTASARSALGLSSFATYAPLANTLIYIDNVGNISSVALGSAGTVLVSQGATSAPKFSAASSSFTYTDAQYIGAI